MGLIFLITSSAILKIASCGYAYLQLQDQWPQKLRQRTSIKPNHFRNKKPCEAFDLQGSYYALSIISYYPVYLKFAHFQKFAVLFQNFVLHQLKNFVLLVPLIWQILQPQQNRADCFCHEQRLRLLIALYLQQILFQQG